LEAAAKERILLVDDSEQNRYVLGRFLRHGGFAIQECSTGEKALELAHQHPALIILDVRLPDISGYLVCRQLKSDPSTMSIPIVQVSAAFTGHEAKAAALESGADAYLSHPIDSDRLVSTVRNLLTFKLGLRPPQD
jgi:CheY-like chemotaxis protein